MKPKGIIANCSVVDVCVLSKFIVPNPSHSPQQQKVDRSLDGNLRSVSPMS